MSPEPTIIHRLLALADQDPQRDAYTFEDAGEPDAPISRQRLASVVGRVASAMQRRNLRGERVLLAYRNTPDFIFAFYACLAAGACAVPVVPPARNRADPRLLQIARDAGARAVLTSSDLVQTLSERLHAADPQTPVFTVEDLQHEGHSQPWPALPAASDLAFLQYTSGSTGTPKGVMVSHANLMANSALIQSALGTHPASRGVFWLPTYHDMGLIGGVIQPLYCGSQVHLMQPAAFMQAPLQWIRLLSDHGATTAAAPNFALDLCCDKTEARALEGVDLSPLNALVCGAEPVRAITIERFLDTFGPYGFRPQAIIPSYGLAEATLYVT